MNELEKHTLRHVLDMLTKAYANVPYIQKVDFANPDKWEEYYNSRSEHQKLLDEAGKWIQSMDIKN